MHHFVNTENKSFLRAKKIQSMKTRSNLVALIANNKKTKPIFF